MKKKKISPEHSFGKAYPEWLNLLENLEDFVEGRTKKMKKIMYPANLFPEVANDSKEQNAKQILIWASNAASMRSSFKFKVTSENWEVFKRTNDKPVSVVTFLPFENVYLQYCYENSSKILLCEQRTLNVDYPELELLEGETYICLTPAEYHEKEALVLNNGMDEIAGNSIASHSSIPSHRGSSLTVVPLEIHLREGVELGADMLNDEFSINDDLYGMKKREAPPFVTAFPEGVDGSRWEEEQQSLSFLTCFFLFLLLLSAKGVRQTTLGKVEGKNVARRKPQHKRQHPMYEYRILELGDGSEPPLFDQSVTREAIRKRCHAVRGFFRHYKKPLKSGPNKGKTAVFVKGHWRGDKELGVIRKDYAFANENSG